jgi:hypothetical protein
MRGDLEELRFFQYLFGDHVQLPWENCKEREYKYLDVCPEFVHLVDAAQDGERGAFEEVAQHCVTG